MLRTSFTGELGQLWEYIFTVSLSRVSFRVQPFFSFLSSVFLFLFFDCVFFQNHIVVVLVVFLVFLCFKWF